MDYPGRTDEDGRNTHRSPCPEVVEILHRRWDVRTHDEGLVFYSTAHKPISDMNMTKVLRTDKSKTITVHGFRSSFTDWAAEETAFANAVVDKALAHKHSDRVEAAYRRTDFFDKRRDLMLAWARYCASLPVRSDKVGRS